MARVHIDRDENLVLFLQKSLQGRTPDESDFVFIKQEEDDEDPVAIPFLEYLPEVRKGHRKGRVVYVSRDKQLAKERRRAERQAWLDGISAESLTADTNGGGDDGDDDGWGPLRKAWLDEISAERLTADTNGGGDYDEEGWGPLRKMVDEAERWAQEHLDAGEGHLEEEYHWVRTQRVDELVRDLPPRAKVDVRLRGGFDLSLGDLEYMADKIESSGTRITREMLQDQHLIDAVTEFALGRGWCKCSGMRVPSVLVKICYLNPAYFNGVSATAKQVLTTTYQSLPADHLDEVTSVPEFPLFSPLEPGSTT